MRGEIKIKVLNLTNTVKVTGPVTTARQRRRSVTIRTQSGFMRLTQLVPPQLLRDERSLGP